MSSLLHANQNQKLSFREKTKFQGSTSSLLSANQNQKLSFGKKLSFKVQRPPFYPLPESETQFSGKTKFQGFNVFPSGR